MHHGPMSPRTQPKMPDVGPVGENLIKAVVQLREARNMTYKKLSEALAELGRPIAPLGLSRLEHAERRVDVDELVALAVVFGVNPNALLFDRRVGRDDVVDLTPAFQQRGGIVWEWADGRMYMPRKLVEYPERIELDQARVADFVTNARPNVARRRDHPAVRAAEDVVTRMLMALMDLEADGGREPGKRVWWKEHVGRALKRLQVEVDDTFAGETPAGVMLSGVGHLGSAVHQAPPAHPAAGAGTARGTDGRL
jgi:transcriptional regulator with XRE-family HTH domain